MSIGRFLLSVTIGVLAAVPAGACTNIFATSDSVRFAAANLDCSNVFPRVWFVPSTDDEFGRFCFGTDAKERTAEGGVNEHGLFIAVNALDSSTGWSADPSRPDWERWEGWLGTGVPDGILAKCSTVEEALTVFRSYNLFTLDRVKFLVADRHGDSAVVEWSDGSIVFVPRDRPRFQVSTNFLQSLHPVDEAPCQRFTIARRMLDETEHPADPDRLRSVLAATHLEFRTPTVLSMIADLQSGTIHLFYFHYYEEEIVFELPQQLAIGRHGYALGDLMTTKPYVAEVYEEFAGRGSR